MAAEQLTPLTTRSLNQGVAGSSPAGVAIISISYGVSRYATYERGNACGTHGQGMERRALSGDIIKSMMGTVLAYITFGGSVYGAVYLLVHDKPIHSLTALITALGPAFGRSKLISSNPGIPRRAKNPQWSTPELAVRAPAAGSCDFQPLHAQ